MKKILKKKVLLFIYILGLLFNVNIFARALEDNYSQNLGHKTYIESITLPPTTVNGDIIHIKVFQGNYPIAKFYIKDLDNNENSYYVPVTRGRSTDHYLSLKNGRYNIYLIDTNNNYNTYKDTIFSINTSCTEESVSNATGIGSVNRCFVHNGSKYIPFSNSNIVTCASGYVIDTTVSGLKTDGCKGLTASSLTEYGVSSRFCQMTYVYSCVKQSAETTSKLASLSLSSGTLSPAFNADTTSYTATVNASSVTINATLNKDGSKFQDGFGPRTVNLKYGKNDVSLKVESSSGKVMVYNITITRPDNRNYVNTLSSLYIDGVNLDKKFSSSVTNYSATVDNDVTKVYVNATLTNDKSSFVNGYGPRSVQLKEGKNEVVIKVKSEAGTIKAYTVVITRKSNEVEKPPVEPPVDTSKLALLKSIAFNVENLNLNPTFDSGVLEYNLIVPYEVSTLLIDAVAENSEDTISITGNEELVVEETNVVEISVSTKDNFIRVYKINVIRKGEEIEISSDSALKELVLEGHTIEFKPDELKYEVVLEKDETELKINAVTNDEKAVIEIKDNEKLSIGSKVTIRVVAEDGSFTDYIVSVTGVRKGVNVFLIVMVVLVLVLIIAYTILRMLGYKIYFNFSMLTSLFRRKKADEDE